VIVNSSVVTLHSRAIDSRKKHTRYDIDYYYVYVVFLSNVVWGEFF